MKITLLSDLEGENLKWGGTSCGSPVSVWYLVQIEFHFKCLLEVEMKMKSFMWKIFDYYNAEKKIIIRCL